MATKRDPNSQMEKWRVITPILSIISPSIVAVLGWFILNGYNEQREINKSLSRDLKRASAAHSALQIDFEKRIGTLQFECCRHKGGRFQ